MQPHRAVAVLCCIPHLRHPHEKKLKSSKVLAEEETAEAEERGSSHARTRQAGAAGRKTMRRPAGSVRAAALAIFFGALVLMSLVVDGGKNPGLPAIAGRRMMTRADGERRASEDVKAGDPFQDSKRRVPNGPDPIHNRYWL
jgi:hypothetical protein